MMIKHLRARNFGFITESEIRAVINENRLYPCLIRFGGCRLVAPAQDVPHIIKCMEKAGDYVRDVSLNQTS